MMFVKVVSVHATICKMCSLRNINNGEAHWNKDGTTTRMSEEGTIRLEERTTGMSEEGTIRLSEKAGTIRSEEEGTAILSSEEDGTTTRMSVNEEGTTRLVE